MGGTNGWVVYSKTVENSGFLGMHFKDVGSHKDVKSDVVVDIGRLSEGFRVA